MNLVKDWLYKDKSYERLFSCCAISIFLSLSYISNKVDYSKIVLVNYEFFKTLANYL